ncbi:MULTISPECIES: LysR family transcriptional regulator [Agrobacterium]|uniref:LysR family transcriptional regulator n=1 Tax=Agrobacterium TaxID=357 RepID=UPI0015717BA5|nr:LysR family transcriptional regulator [Agrobacterium sp. OT33]MBO0127955.1 LysR family transcriptional regulator [Agrobacterium sp. OT33]NTA46385.1 LysR family transcriptional regulator [Agrobacterium tumefaciens]
MPDLSLDLRYLTYAILVAEHGSFRAAAQALDLSQSTISRRVQLLERRIGIALFDRSRKGAELTPAGARFLQSAAVGASHMEQAILDTRKAHRGEIGELRIGVVTSLANGFLGDLLESYRAAYPSVEVRVEEVSQRIAGTRLLSRRLDVAFLAGAPELPGCTTTRMWNERLVVALPKSHRLAELPSLPWDDLREETFLSPANDKGVEMESLLLRKLYESGSSPGISVHDVGRDDLLTLAARGFGVFMTLESTVSEDYRNLAFVPVGDDTDIVEFSAVLLTEHQNPAISPFLKFAAARSFYPIEKPAARSDLKPASGT